MAVPKSNIAPVDTTALADHFVCACSWAAVCVVVTESVVVCSATISVYGCGDSQEWRPALRCQAVVGEFVPRVCVRGVLIVPWIDVRAMDGWDSYVKRAECVEFWFLPDFMLWQYSQDNNAY